MRLMRWWRTKKNLQNENPDWNRKSVKGTKFFKGTGKGKDDPPKAAGLEWFEHMLEELEGGETTSADPEFCKGCAGARDGSGWSALHFACKVMNATAVHLFVEGMPQLANDLSYDKSANGGIRLSLIHI